MQHWRGHHSGVVGRDRLIISWFVLADSLCAACQRSGTLLHYVAAAAAQPAATAASHAITATVWGSEAAPQRSQPGAPAVPWLLLMLRLLCLSCCSCCACCAHSQGWLGSSAWYTALVWV